MLIGDPTPCPLTASQSQERADNHAIFHFLEFNPGQPIISRQADRSNSQEQGSDLSAWLHTITPHTSVPMSFSRNIPTLARYASTSAAGGQHKVVVIGAGPSFPIPRPAHDR
jgi:hypothetical protein